MEGWIKLYRKLLDHPIFRSNDPKILKTFLYCLLRAGHKERDIFFNHQLIHLKPGEFITGREEAAKDLGFSPKTFDRKINDLQKLQIVTRSVTRRFSIILVTKWNTYQNGIEKDDPLNGTNVHARCTRDACEMTTNKKVKKGKNGEKPPSIVPPEGESPPPDFDVSKYRVFEGCDRTKVYNYLKKWNLLDTEEQPSSQPADVYEGHLFGTMDLEERSAWLVDSWNSLCTREDVGLLEVTLTPERIAHVESKLMEVPDFLYEWADILGRIALGLPFLRGDNSRGWKADFDWVLQGDNWKMILDDKFLDPEGAIKAFFGDDPGPISPADSSQWRDPESPEPPESQEGTPEAEEMFF